MLTFTITLKTKQKQDFVPTILDGANVRYPTHAKAGRKPASLTGTSLLNSAQNYGTQDPSVSVAFASHQFHSLYEYYPMRSITKGNYRRKF